MDLQSVLKLFGTTASRRAGRDPALMDDLADVPVLGRLVPLVANLFGGEAPPESDRANRPEREAERTRESVEARLDAIFAASDLAPPKERMKSESDQPSKKVSPSAPKVQFRNKGESKKPKQPKVAVRGDQQRSKTSKKKPIGDQWREEKTKQQDRTLESDLKDLANAPVPVGRPDTTKNKTKPLPKFYHQKDDAGNTLANLLQERKRAKGKRAKRAVKAKIDAWTAQHDAQRKSPEFGYSTKDDPELKRRSKRSSRHSKQKTTSTTKQWEKAKSEQPTEPTLTESLKTVQEAQDQAFANPAPKQSPTTMPAPKGWRTGLQPMSGPISQTPPARKPQDSDSADEENAEPSGMSTAVDTAQLVLDAIGVVDPTPISDGINAGVSLVRAFVSDPERRKEHLQNAAISGVSMVPYVGDAAKLAKIGRAGKTVSRATKLAAGGSAKGTTALAKRKASEDARKMGSRVNGSASVGFGGKPPSKPPTTNATPDPSGDGDFDGSPSSSIRDQRRRREGIKEHDSFVDRLQQAGKALLGFLGPLGKMTVGGVAFVQSLNMLNTGVLALNRDLEEFNGKIAASYAKADVADMHRKIEKGERVGDSLSDLNDAQSELKDNLAEIVDPLQSFGNRALTEVTKLVNLGMVIATPVTEVYKAVMYFGEKGLELFGKITDGVKAIVDWLPGVDFDDSEETELSVPKFLDDIADGKLDGKTDAGNFFTQHGEIK